MAAISPKQIAAIHASAKNAGLDEEARRDVIESATGKRSAKGLTSAEGFRVIEAIKGLSQGSQSPPSTGRSPAKTMSGRYAGVLRALWLSGYNLGVVENRDDTALIAFVERQTKIAHPRFLLDAADAMIAIEGLKKWISREALVNWNEKFFVTDHCEVQGYVSGERQCRKRSVLAAQRERLRGHGMDLPDWPAATASDESLDALIAENGRQILEAVKHAQRPQARRSA
jgi:hypothetical protein